MITPFEFIVNGFMTGFAGELRIVGRCGDVSIRVGDIFCTLRDKADGTVRPVQLEVVAIQAYGRRLHELGFGMTASIDVRGDGVEWIRPFGVLMGNTADEMPARDSTVTVGTAEHV